MPMRTAISLISAFARISQTGLAEYVSIRAYSAFLALVTMFVVNRGSRQDVYNVLWAVVFGFATLNILSLAARRMEPSRRGWTFGEILAVMIVLLSVFLLTWELLNIFHTFPIRLKK